MITTTIVVPLYGAAPAARRCLESVDRTLAAPRRILVIDDASPNGETESLLTWAATRPGFEICRNQRNLGFASTCNLGIAWSAPADVLLLNADTVVSAGWLEGIERCAQSAAGVGSVTPLSNNATIASVPRWLVANDLPRDFDVDGMARLVARTSLRSYPALPTGVGFCLWMARAAIAEVGGFDETRFGAGYGEENDWCLRAGAAGWSHRLDDATFVYHEGAASFGAATGDRKAAAAATMRARHPGYEALVGGFIAARPLREIHDNLQVALELSASRRPQVLQIAPWPFDLAAMGGVQVHGAVLERALAGRVDFTVAYLAGTELRVERRLADGRQLGWVFPAEDAITAVAALLDVLPIDLVHIHGLGRLPTSIVAQMRRRAVPWIVSVHDQSLGSPAFADLLADACRVVAPSRSALELLSAAPAAVEIIPHGAPVASPVRSGARRPGPLRIAAVGNRTAGKGLDVIARLCEATRGAPVLWHWLGGDPAGRSLPAGMRDLGTYQRDEYARCLAEAEIDLVVLASTVPETHSMTLSETWAAGVPVLASRMGALAERVSRGGGWLFDLDALPAAAALLTRLAADPSALAAAASEARATQQPTEPDMAAAYERLYREVIAEHPRPIHPPIDPLGGRLIGRARHRAAAAPWSERMQARGGSGPSLLARFHALKRNPAYCRSPLRRLLPESLRARLEPPFERLLGRFR